LLQVCPLPLASCGFLTIFLRNAFSLVFLQPIFPYVCFYLPTTLLHCLLYFQLDILLYNMFLLFVLFLVASVLTFSNYICITYSFYHMLLALQPFVQGCMGLGLYIWSPSPWLWPGLRFLQPLKLVFSSSKCVELSLCFHSILLTFLSSIFRWSWLCLCFSSIADYYLRLFILESQVLSFMVSWFYHLFFILIFSSFINLGKVNISRNYSCSFSNPKQAHWAIIICERHGRVANKSSRRSIIRKKAKLVLWIQSGPLGHYNMWAKNLLFIFSAKAQYFFNNPINTTKTKQKTKCRNFPWARNSPCRPKIRTWENSSISEVRFHFIWIIFSFNAIESFKGWIVVFFLDFLIYFFRFFC